MRHTSTSGGDAAPNPEVGFEPGSHGRVLRNRRHITHRREMDRAELSALLEAQQALLARLQSAERLTTELICEMHAEWLGPLYEWAGRYRRVDLEKDDYRWLAADVVPEAMVEVEETVLAEHTPCPPGDPAEVAARLAAVHAELLRVHPFREGNGRLARWVAGIMALQAGYVPPAWGFSGRGGPEHREAYLAAVRRAYEQDCEDLVRFLQAALERQDS